MSQPTQSPQQKVDKPKPVHTVEIIVNTKKVTVPKKVTGAEIKAAAKVPADFDLYWVKGKQEIQIADNEQLTVKDRDKFTASPTLDPSFVEHPMQATAVESVRDAFPGHVVDVGQPGDGSALIAVRELAVGEGWNPATIDLEVNLQVTFPSTPPYPFYGPAGMTRTDGMSLVQIQQVALGGQMRTQISLTKPFDPATETLGSRFAAVARWLRNPR
jgi:hypothetical protein